ncbi:MULTISPECIES: formate/nitrite transporter family protein [Lactobacillus]|uniref:Formate/nitrite transporter family protein n=1 Tax=Lactobacillus xujianguonis TaxID=2495899 RepID=A0A437STF6_9LACO|nr:MULTISPECIES: formate/nitrite transporter family protein [Lactobacillus]RVU70144.1 formate/nitrite transporter family protein [Lactobacillus xujianguonis]RVU73362.1 formate/nitrite transporter family protein [Lactobacillus xujianguonis]
MYADAYEAASNAAAKKFSVLKSNPLGYVALSILAGMYIGFGILLAFTIGAQLGNNPASGLIKGLIFGVALSLVIIPGAELFTGNNFVMGAGMFKHKVSVGQAICLWIICWLGNLVGATLLSWLFTTSGFDIPAVATVFTKAAAAKMSVPAFQLVLRGILCNILVCLAVWSTFRTKDDTAKLLMTWWCLLAFFSSGFEHSVANMTTLIVALLNPAKGAGVVTMGGLWYNLLWVSLGNIIGGLVFVALPYWLGSKLKKTQDA